MIFQLMFPLFVTLLFLILLNSFGMREGNAGVDKVLAYEALITLFLSYIFFSIPHFVIMIFSVFMKMNKLITNTLLLLANFILIGFCSYIIILKYLHYRDLSLLWIFYWPIALLAISLTWLMIRIWTKKAKNEA